jgi:chromosome segregation ATPase
MSTTRVLTVEEQEQLEQSAADAIAQLLTPVLASSIDMPNESLRILVELKAREIRALTSRNEADRLKWNDLLNKAREDYLNHRKVLQNFIEELERQLVIGSDELLRTEIKNLHKQINQLTVNTQTLAADSAQLQLALDAKSSKYNAAKNVIKAFRTTVTTLETDLNTSQSHLTSAHEAIRLQKNEIQKLKAQLATSEQRKLKLAKNTELEFKTTLTTTVTAATASNDATSNVKIEPVVTTSTATSPEVTKFKFFKQKINGLQPREEIIIAGDDIEKDRYQDVSKDNVIYTSRAHKAPGKFN